MATTTEGSDTGRIVSTPINAEMHRALHSDPEKLEKAPSPEISPAKRRQPFSAVWTVIACGFALMSDGAKIQVLGGLIGRISQFGGWHSEYDSWQDLSGYVS